MLHELRTIADKIKYLSQYPKWNSQFVTKYMMR